MLRYCTISTVEAKPVGLQNGELGITAIIRADDAGGCPIIAISNLIEARRLGTTGRLAAAGIKLECEAGGITAAERGIISVAQVPMLKQYRERHRKPSDAD